MEPWLILPLAIGFNVIVWLVERSNTNLGRRLRKSTRDAGEEAIQKRLWEIEQIELGIRKVNR